MRLTAASEMLALGACTERTPGTARTTGATLLENGYGPGLAGRVGHVDKALDVAGAGSLPDLVAVTGDPARVLTIADFTGPQHGVRVSWAGSGDPDGRAGLAELGRVHVVLRDVLPMARAAEAHRAVESGHGAGKIVLTVP